MKTFESKDDGTLQGGLSSRPHATIREAYVEASSFLRGRGVADAESNAELLLMHLLGMNKSALLLGWRDSFPAEREAAWRDMLARKANGEPAQYIIGEQEFYGLPFTVSPAVLIPRPETELLVEAVVAAGRKLWTGPPPLLADIGTGSGAIAISGAVLCPSWRWLSSDLSPAALAMTRHNAARNGVAARIEFVEGDLLAPFVERQVVLDAVVSNPPYIVADELPGLQPEVRLHEPVLALVGGTDGLDPYRRMAAQLPELAALPALVGFEVGRGQAAAVAELLARAADWDEVRIVPDLAGIDRHVVAVAAARARR